MLHDLNCYIDIDRVEKTLKCLLIFFFFLSFLVPLYPSGFNASLDPSWGLALNEAYIGNMIFGKDVIFTFGPYSSIFSRQYHPSTDNLMLFGSLYLAVMYTLVIYFISKNVQFLTFLSVISIIFLCNISGDVLLFSYPLVASLLVIRLLDQKVNTDDTSFWSTAFVLASLFFPFGLLILIKGTLIVISLGLLVMIFIFVLFSHHRKFLFIPLASACTSLVFFWLISGQGMAYLDNYLFSMFPIIAGYSAAMSLESDSIGERAQILLYITTTLIFFMSIYNGKDTLKNKLFIILTSSLFLFLAFKQGFVRHDAHALAASSALIVLGLLLPLYTQLRYRRLSLFFVALTWLLTDATYIKTSTETLIFNTKDRVFKSIEGLKHRADGSDFFKERFIANKNNIASILNLPKFEGTVDIYSYEQGHLLSTDNEWTPRPIIQSYSAYTARLAEINFEFINGTDGPDNILFNVQTIDGRLPSMDDGISWLALLNKYEPKQFYGEYLHLVRSEVADELALKPLSVQSISLGEAIELNPKTSPVFLKANIQSSFIGKLLSLLFKPPQLNIEVTLNNGSILNYRVVAKMLQSGLLISPFIQDTKSFSKLYSELDYLRAKFVTTLKISSVGNEWAWRDKYNIEFLTFNIPRPSQGSFSAMEFNSKLNLNHFDVNNFVERNCDGVIDNVLGVNPVPELSIAGDFLSLDGWLAKSTSEGVLPEKIYIYKRTGNDVAIWATSVRERADVAKYFNKPSLVNIGYESYIDLSQYSNGLHKFGIAYSDEMEFVLCSQLKINLEISRNR
jgi:hypothetical protein